VRPAQPGDPADAGYHLRNRPGRDCRTAAARPPALDRLAGHAHHRGAHRLGPGGGIHQPRRARPPPRSPAARALADAGLPGQLQLRDRGRDRVRCAAGVPDPAAPAARGPGRTIRDAWQVRSRHHLLLPGPAPVPPCRPGSRAEQPRKRRSGDRSQLPFWSDAAACDSNVVNTTEALLPQDTGDLNLLRDIHGMICLAARQAERGRPMSGPT
jgi:hypothetical protein